ncbi:hypothetical protein [Crocosphaera sp. XPORK-15E]|uniref:WD40 repeat domain-containing protein n=1 Tax=Crocosphaera sp. XPORK-15E TaxID=3110247 RepID=UPI002B20DB87|nr:hypothetical protein [Crocosphaera sp. XPORK-15E]MEA5535494.1 hypothetical protein [Crocosphaera sp. XPORK-15E]
MNKTSSFRIRAYLTSFPYNAAKSNHLTEYYQTLTKFQFLQDKINFAGLEVQGLIEDYDYIKQLDATPQQVKTLQLIQDTLRLSAHILQVDSTQLSSQLWGRLLRFIDPPQPPLSKGESNDIQTLLKQAEQTPTHPRLLPYTPSFTPPDTPLIRTLTGHSSSVNSVVVTPNGNKVISGSRDNTLKVWSLETGKLLQTLTGHSNWVNSVVVTPDGNQVISGILDNTVMVWDLNTGKCLATFYADYPIWCCQIAPDGVTIIAGDSGGIVHFLRWLGG